MSYPDEALVFQSILTGEDHEAVGIDPDGDLILWRNGEPSRPFNPYFWVPLTPSAGSFLALAFERQTTAGRRRLGWTP